MFSQNVTRLQKMINEGAKPYNAAMYIARLVVSERNLNRPLEFQNTYCAELLQAYNKQFQK